MNKPLIVKIIYILIIFCFLSYIFSCITLPQKEENRTKINSIPIPVEDKTATDPGVIKIEDELSRVYDYKDKAMVKLQAIKALIQQILPMIDQCKAPVNLITPFMFSNTTIAPSDVLYRKYSLKPCAFYMSDAEIAAHNSSNHFTYVENIFYEINAAKQLISESCADNGMSDYFKALVKNSLLSFQTNAEAEITKFGGFINDITLFLQGYKNCLQSLES